MHMRNSTLYFALTSFIGMWGSFILANLETFPFNLVWMGVALFWGYMWWKVMRDYREEMQNELNALQDAIKREMEQAKQHESKS